MSIQHTMSSRIARRLLGVIVTVVLATMTQFSGVQAGEPTLDQPTDEIPLDAVVHLPLIMTPHRTFLPLVYARPPLDRPYPANDATRQSLNSYLSWEAVDARLQGASYTVYLERDDATPDEAIVAGLTKTAYDPFTLEENTRYYWQVTATAADGQQFNSPVWSFTTDYFPDIPETDLMVEVPAGPFMMGCDGNNNGGYICSSVDTPLHEVYLDAYRIDKHEVTNKEYRACVEAGACNLPRKFGSETRNEYFFETEFDYYPVVYVSHWDAEDFCAWEGKRLPTEAEWEKSARGAIDTRPFPWGAEPFDCTRANHRCTEPNDTTRVDDFRSSQSPYGLLNVSGNVWEWVQDYYYDFYYTITPYVNPVLTVNMQDPNIPYFTVRGGCFRHAWQYLRTFHRKGGHWGDTIFEGSNDKPLFRSSMYGFRCAQSVTGE
jgi:formylglycine-generating enzyme required for sulfatase activity